jgi:hypothetical protein
MDREEQEGQEDSTLDWRVTLYYASADFTSRVTWEGTILQVTRDEALRVARLRAGVEVTEAESRITRVTTTAFGGRTELAPASAAEAVVELRDALATNVYSGDDGQPFDVRCDAFDDAARLISELAEPPDFYIRL